jgi:signal transduction histidine kinase/phage shock protein PspC (stress-responsive transcriptional regulator)
VTDTAAPTGATAATPSGGPAAVPLRPWSPRTPGRTRKLYRAADRRVVGGVASGLALHLGIEVWVVRVAFVLLAVTGGAGVAMYAAFWALVPLAPSGEPFPDAAPAPASAGAARGTGRSRADARAVGDDQSDRLGPLLALGAVVLGGVLVAQQLGLGPSGPIAVPLVVVGLGVAVLWRVADDTQRERLLRTAGATGGGRAWVRIVIGVVLVLVGAAAVLGARGGIQAAVDGLAGALVVVGGVALVAGPWLARSARELRDERRERIRSQERAELAAHVHDSVVQTLTLIQRNADDPREVTRLARAEERALRQWLYRPGTQQPGSFQAALEAAAADVEDVHGGAVEVVVVGDATVDERLGALVQATREAMVNAAKYAADAGPVSVYAEVDGEQVQVFVRDRGPGFDLDAVPEDRLGVRQSIIGRMQRHSGRAEVVTAPGEGAEVRLSMPRAASVATPAAAPAPPAAEPDEEER